MSDQLSDQTHLDADVQPDAALDAGHDLLDKLAGLVDLGGDVAPVAPGLPDGGDAGMPVAPGGDAGPVDAGPVDAPVDAPVDGGPEVHLPVDGDPAPVDPNPIDLGGDPAPVDPAPIDHGGDPAPVDPAPVDPAPVDPAPVDHGGDPAPVDPAPVDPAPVDPAPVDHGGDPAPVDPVPPVDGGAGHDPAPVPPVVGDHDGTTPPPAGSGDHAGEDAPTPPADDHNATSGDPVPDQGHAGLPTDDTSHTPEPVHVDPISLPVADVPHELPSTVSDAVPPSADLHAITGSLTTALGATPTPVPDFHLAAPTADAATLLVPDGPELPTMHVTDVDHAAGTVTAAPVGMPGAPSMTLPLDQVQAAHEESGSPALSFATGGAAGALTSLTVVALAARKLRKA